MSAIEAEVGGENMVRAYRIGSMTPALAKNARTGHPRFRF